MDNNNDFPYDFDGKICKTCRGKCCRGFGGYVWISINEIKMIAAASKMDVELFAGKFVRRVQGRFSLTEKIINGEHFCCFFDRIDCICTIYHNRPHQCRTFPFWNKFKTNFQELLLECPGVYLK